MKRRLTKVLSVLCIAALLLTSLDVSAAKKKKPKLKKTKVSIQVGKTHTIKITNKVKKAKYSFKSSKKKVATVNKKGKVTGVKAGKANITVSQKLKKKTTKVGVLKVTVTAAKKPDVTAPATAAPTAAPATTAPTAAPATTAPTVAPTTAAPATATPTPTTPPTEPPVPAGFDVTFNDGTADTTVQGVAKTGAGSNGLTEAVDGGYKFTYGTYFDEDGQEQGQNYDGSFAVVEVTLPEGKKIADYKYLNFTYEGLGGDITNKPLIVLADVKSDDPKALGNLTAITTSEKTSTYPSMKLLNEAASVGATTEGSVEGKGAQEIQMDLDAPVYIEYAEPPVMTTFRDFTANRVGEARELVFVFYIHATYQGPIMDNNGDGILDDNDKDETGNWVFGTDRTAYQITDVEFVEGDPDGGELTPPPPATPAPAAPRRGKELVDAGDEAYDETAGGLVFEEDSDSPWGEYANIVQIPIPADVDMSKYQDLVLNLAYEINGVQVNSLADPYANHICFQIYDGVGTEAVYQQWNHVAPNAYSQALPDAVKTADFSGGNGYILIQGKSADVTKVVVKSVKLAFAAVEMVDGENELYDEEAGGYLFEEDADSPWGEYANIVQLPIPADVDLSEYQDLMMEIAYEINGTQVNSLADPYANHICFQIYDGVGTEAVYQQWNHVAPNAYSQALPDAVKAADFSGGNGYILIQGKSADVTKVIVKSVRFEKADEESGSTEPTEAPDSLDSLVVEYPLHEDFEDGDYLLAYSIWDKDTSSLTPLADADLVTAGEGFVTVGSNTYNGISIPLDNRGGDAAADFYIEATVNTTDANPSGKVSITGGNSFDASNAASAYWDSNSKKWNSDIYESRSVGTAPYVIKAKASGIAAGKIAEARLMSQSVDFEVSDIKVQAWADQSLDMEPEVVVEVTDTLTESENLAVDTPMAGGTGYVNEGAVYTMAGGQYSGQIKFALSKPVKVSDLTSIVFDVTTTNNLALKFFNGDGAEIGPSGGTGATVFGATFPYTRLGSEFTDQAGLITSVGIMGNEANVTFTINSIRVNVAGDE